jgi:hypothetical protein
MTPLRQISITRIVAFGQQKRTALPAPHGNGNSPGSGAAQGYAASYI